MFKRLILATLTALLCLAPCSLVHGMIFGPFRGIQSLVERSEYITIMRVESPALRVNGQYIREDVVKARLGPNAYDPTWGTGGESKNYFCTPLRMIKGSSDTLARSPIAIWSIDYPRSSAIFFPDADGGLNARYDAYLKTLPEGGPAIGPGTIILVFANAKNYSLAYPIIESLNCTGSVLVPSPAVAQARLMGAKPLDQARNLIDRLVGSSRVRPVAAPASSPTPALKNK